MTQPQTPHNSEEFGGLGKTLSTPLLRMSCDDDEDGDEEEDEDEL